MHIDRIQAENFKAFETLDIHTDGKSLVIFGVNGTGKSTVLSIINYVFWSWIYKLNPSQGIAYRTFSADMVRYGKSKMIVQVDIELDKKFYKLERTYLKAKIGKKAVSTTNKKEYDSFVAHFMKEYIEMEKNIPIFVNYGTNRSVLEIPLRIKNKHNFSTIASLDRAVENELDFRTFFEWYRNQEDIENEKIRDLGDNNYKDKSLECVRQAIYTMLGDDYSDLKIKRNPLCMKVKKGNMDIRVDQLSDGEKCTIALFGDLARRIAMANPLSENPLNGKGIVMIDEIELHMHPMWQRRVLGVLRKVFPNIQFIITTHSPQVLGEADDSYKVLRLCMSENNRVDISEEYIYGKDSNGILKTIMNTSERSETVQKMFDEFYNFLDTENYKEAEEKLESIEEVVADNDPEVAACWVKLDLEQI